VFRPALRHSAAEAKKETKKETRALHCSQQIMDDDYVALCVRFGVLLAITAICMLLTILSREGHAVPVRTSACPSPLLPFPAGVDEEGTYFNYSFAAKRDYGAWHATVELGTMDDSDDFSAAGPKFQVDGCHWWSPWVKNRYINLIDEGGEVLASIDSDPLSFGWKFKFYDCKGQLTHSVEESRGPFIKGADLTVFNAAGQQVGKSTYDWAWLGTNVMTLREGGGQGSVVARATTPSVHVGTQEWRLYSQGGSGAGDPAVIGAIASYKTWADKKKCKKCGKNDFTGTCEHFIFWGEILLVAAICFTGAIVWQVAGEACCNNLLCWVPGCWDGASDCCRAIKNKTRSLCSPSVSSKQASVLPSMRQHIDNPMHAQSPIPKATVAIFETDSARNTQWSPMVTKQFSPVLPAGSQLPPTVSV